jgi:two-component system phosphate regulon response regulator OmpR
MVVDDDPGIRDVLQEYFAEQGYEVIAADSAADARSLAASRAIDVALLDVQMPGEDGLSLVRHVRERYAGTAIIMLTSAAATVDRIVGLEMGADDYVPKPFDPRELSARVKSVLRRTSRGGSGRIDEDRVRVGLCILDIAAHRLTDGAGGEVPITALEFDLLQAFAGHPNRPLSRERIMNLARRTDWDALDRSVDLRVMRVRRKIEPDPSRPRYIRTVRSEGYVFVPDGC